MSHILTTECELDRIAPLNVQSEHAETVSSLPNALPEGESVIHVQELSKSRTVALIAILAGVTFISSFSNGLLTVGLPRMAKDLALPGNLLLWYDCSTSWIGDFLFPWSIDY